MNDQLNRDCQLDMFSAIPAHWDDDPSAQLVVLRDAIVRQRDFPTAVTPAFMDAAFYAVQWLRRDHGQAAKVEALITIAAFNHLEGNEEIAVDAATRSIEAAVLGKHRSLEARARMVYATILKTMYQLSRSLDEFSRALELARSEGDVVTEAKIVNNFAGWYYFAGQHLDALAMYEQLALYYQDKSNRGGLLMALSNASLTALRIGDIGKATGLIERAKPLVNDPNSADQKLRFVQHAVTYCQLLVLANRDDEAAAVAKDALGIAVSPGCPKEAHILAEIAEAIVAFPADPNSIDRIIARSKQHSQTAAEIALDAAVRVYEHCGCLDKALSIQYERIAFQEVLKFSQVREMLGRRSAEETEGVAKVVQLETAIDRKVTELVSAAVSQSLRSGYDHAHIFRVSRLAQLFAIHQDWPVERADTLALAAKLIDLGMMVLPPELLLKPRQLFEAERRLALEHVRFGADLLDSARLAILAPCIPIVRYHHERWDGRGPSALAEYAIPVEARIVTLCDCFDALTHTRPWRPAFPVEVALQTILDGAGTHFDPVLAARFVDFVRQEVIASDDLETRLDGEAWENDFVRTQLRVEQLLRGQRRLFAA
jgi:putative two-component system response regulator